jgi:hypothetical protein
MGKCIRFILGGKLNLPGFSSSTHDILIRGVRKVTGKSLKVFHFKLGSFFVMKVSCGIFEHFAMLPDPVTEFIKLGSALHKQGDTLAPKLADLLSLLNKRIHPFYLDIILSQTQIQ